MSLLNVTVKRVKYLGEQSNQFNTYVTLKLQNVKISTQCQKGSEPVWDQDFSFETTTIHTGLVVEIWSKNLLLDRVIGYVYIPLDSIAYNQYDYTSYDQWYNVDSEQIVNNGVVQGTRNPTGHMIFLNVHYDTPPCDNLSGYQQTNNIGYNSDFNNQEQYIQNYNNIDGYNNEYQNENNYQYQTSYDTNYGQIPTVPSSFDNSRQNSYERDESQYYDASSYYNDQYQDASPYINGEVNEDYEDGFFSYNSRPFDSNSSYNNHRTVRQLSRRNLERQNTFYDGGSQPNEDQNETWSEMNYNSGYNNDDNYGEYNQYDGGNYQGCSNQKSLPLPPSTTIAASQSAYDGFGAGFRGAASLPVTPMIRANRHLPQQSATSFADSKPVVSQSGLPTISSSLGSAASKLTSLFGGNKSSTVEQQKNLPSANNGGNNLGGIYDQYQAEPTLCNNSYNYDDYTNQTDEYMTLNYDGDNNNLVNRYGAALPTPAQKIDEYSTNTQYGETDYYSEPTYTDISTLGKVDPLLEYDSQQYIGDEYHDASMYSSDPMDSTNAMGYYSPKKSKALPLPTTTTQSELLSKTTTASSSIIGSAGAGISSLFSSLSSSLHPTTTTSSLTTSTYSTSYSSSIFTSSISNSYQSPYSTTVTTTSSTLSFLNDSLYTPSSSSFLSSIVTTTTSSLYGISTSSSALYSSPYSAYTSKDYSSTLTSLSSSNNYGLLSSLTTSLDTTLYTSSNLYSTPTTTSSSSIDYLMPSLSKGYSSYLLTSESNNITSSSIYNSSSFHTPMDTSYISQTSEVSVPSSSSFYDANSYLSSLTPKTTDQSKIGLTTSTSSYLSSYLTSTTVTSTVTTTSSSSIFSPFSSLFGTGSSSVAITTTTPSITTATTTSSSLSFSISTPFFNSLGSGTTSDLTTTTTTSSDYSSYLSSSYLDSITTTSSSISTSVPSYSSIYSRSSFTYTPSITLTSELPTTTSSLSYVDSISKLTSTTVPSINYSTSSLTSMYPSISDSLTTESQSFSSTLDYSSSAAITTSVYTSPYTSLSGYGTSTSATSYSNYGLSSYGILGHSPIPEENEENENLAEDITEEEESTDIRNLSLDNMGIGNELDTLDQALVSDSVRKNSYISDLYYSYNTIKESNFEEEYKEDFEEGVVPVTTNVEDDFYDPAPEPYLFQDSRSNSLSLDTNLGIDSLGYGRQNILSSIPETGNGYSSSLHELEEEPEIYEEPPVTTVSKGYSYTENETDYIASGDLKDTNVYQSQNNNTQTQSSNFLNTTTMPVTTSITTNLGFPSASSLISGTSLFSSKPAEVNSTQANRTQPIQQQQQQQPPPQQQQPQPKKSKFGFGSFLSDGLNVLGSSVNQIKSTATNIAGGAVGAVGAVVAAGAQAAAPKTGPQQAGTSTMQQQNTQQNQMQQNQIQQNQMQQNQMQQVPQQNTMQTQQPNQQQQQQHPQSMFQNQNSSSSLYDTTGNIQMNHATLNNQMSNDQTMRNNNQKLTKQTTSIFEEQYDAHDPYKQHKDDPIYEEDYCNEEYEDRYLEEEQLQQQRAAENNNYMMNNYDENAQMDEYEEMYSHDNNENMYEDMNKLENRDIMHNRNDTNNNANGELYGYHNHQQHYDDQMKNKTNLAVNNNLSEEEYYEDYEEEDKMMLKQQNDRYEEEFDIEYAQNSNMNSKQQQIVQKQMSVLSEDAHQNDEYMNGKNSMLNDEERALQDEYLDEYPEDDLVSHHKQSAVSTMMRKQESVLEDDPELKLLEEKQIQKNQQMQQQQLSNELYPQNDPQMDQFVELEMKQKKMVSINTDGEMILPPEKPRPQRTAKERWHWAYNLIVHRARVSQFFTFFITPLTIQIQSLKNINKNLFWELCIEF